MNSETIPEIESHLKILITEENPTWDVYDLYLGAHSSHIGALRKGVSHHDLRQWRGVLSAKIKTCYYCIEPSQGCPPPGGWGSKFRRRCRAWRERTPSWIKQWALNPNYPQLWIWKQTYNKLCVYKLVMLGWQWITNPIQIISYENECGSSLGVCTF